MDFSRKDTFEDLSGWAGLIVFHKSSKYTINKPILSFRFKQRAFSYTYFYYSFAQLVDQNMSETSQVEPDDIKIEEGTQL